jgi:hypothetical protein
MRSMTCPVALFMLGLLLVQGVSSFLSPPPSVAAAENETAVSAGDYQVIEVPNSVGGGFEPHILAAPSIEGREWIYIDSPTGLGSGQSGNLYISKDHGDTWTPNLKGIIVSSALGSGDSYTAVTNDGTIYFTDLWLFTATVDTSNDGGATWVKNPQASVTPLDDRQWFALGPSIGNNPLKQPQSLYFEYNQIPAGLYLMKSQVTKWGWGWRPCNKYLPISSDTGARDNFVVDQQDGTIYLPNTEGGQKSLEMYISTDGCASFKKTHVFSSDKIIQNIFTVADIDAAGNIYIVWSTQDNVSMARSTDKGNTWDVFNVTTTTGTRVLPWITAGDEGRIGISYYETNASGNCESFDTNVSWNVMSAISIDALAAQPNFTFQEVINYTHSGAIRVTGTGGDSDRDLGDFLSNDMDQYGRHIITFGMDLNDGPNKYDAKVMFARQREGPFLKKGVGPIANFTYRIEGMKVYVDGTRSYDMSGEGLKAYDWIWGDGQNDSGIEPQLSHGFKKAGTYIVTLRVTNGLDMTDTNTQTIKVKVSGGISVSPPLMIAAIVIIAAVLMTYIFRKKIKGIFGRKDRVTK